MAEGHQAVSVQISDQPSDPTVSHTSEKPPDLAAPVSTSEQLCDPTASSHTLEQPIDPAVRVQTTQSHVS
jgi:hypothetical protein